MFIKYGNLSEVPPELHTGRPDGRLDYQLIYIAAGKGSFLFQNNTPSVLNAGHMVLY